MLHSIEWPEHCCMSDMARRGGTETNPINFNVRAQYLEDRLILHIVGGRKNVSDTCPIRF